MSFWQALSIDDKALALQATVGARLTQKSAAQILQTSPSAVAGLLYARPDGRRPAVRGARGARVLLRITAVRSPPSPAPPDTGGDGLPNPDSVPSPPAPEADAPAALPPAAGAPAEAMPADPVADDATPAPTADGRLAVVSAMLSEGATYGAIGARLGDTHNAVAGFVWRARKAGLLPPPEKRERPVPAETIAPRQAPKGKPAPKPLAAPAPQLPSAAPAVPRPSEYARGPKQSGWGFGRPTPKSAVPKAVANDLAALAADALAAGHPVTKCPTVHAMGSVDSPFERIGR